MSSRSSSQSTPAPVEAPNSLISISNIRIQDLLCEGLISGFVLKSGAYGSDPLCSTYYDEVPVRNLDGSYNFNVSGQGYFFDYTLGTQNQSVIGNFAKVENVIPLSSNTRLANPPAGAGLLKYVVAGFNTTTYPDINSVKVTVRVPALLTSDNNGNINGFELKYAIDISLNNGPFIQQEEVTIRGKCTSPYLKETSYVLPKTAVAQEYYDYKVRVRRTTQNILSTKTQNELYVDSITVISNNSFNYPNTVLTATEISADQFASIPFRAYEVNGLLVNVPNGYVPTTYHPNGTITAAQYPGTWNGSWNSTKRWTDNPAWIFYDILVNDRYGLGQYVQTGLIDKWSLYEISQYCDEMVDDGAGGTEPRFTCNVVISERQDAYQFIQNLVSVFRGMVYWGNGRIFPTQTSDKLPVFNYTNANVIDGKFSYSDTATNVRSTVAMVKWSDPSNLYRESVEYIEDREGIARYGYIVKEVTAFACTSRGQAYRVGNWILQTEKILTETVTFQVGLDGLYIRPGDVFNIYDNFRNNKDQGGRVNKFNALRNELTLDREVIFDPNITYTVSCIVPAGSDLTGVVSSTEISGIRPQQIQTRVVTTYTGGENAVVVTDSPFNTNLYPGSVWILSYSGTGSVFQRSTPYKCLATSEPSPGIVEILGLQYNSGINDSIESNYTTVSLPENNGDPAPISPATSLTSQIVDGFYTNNTYFRYIQLDWTDTVSTNLSYYIVSGKPFGGTYSIVGTPATNTFNYNVSVTGLHEFVVIARSVGGVQSTPESTSITVPSTSPVGPPAELSGVEIVEIYDPQYTNSDGNYTGYLFTDPSFRWTLSGDTNGNLATGVQFYSGYKVYLQTLPSATTFSGPHELVGRDSTELQVTKNLLNTGDNGGPVRAFRFFVQVVDDYGNHVNGAALDVNNPAPSAPFDSGFFATRGGINYSIVPNEKDQDISGVYLWFTGDISFVPKFTNPYIKTTNLAGFVANNQTGDYYTWYSLIDYFGTGNCQIFGPISTPLTVWATRAELTGASGYLESFTTGVSGALSTSIALTSGHLFSGARETLAFALSDEETAITVGTGKLVTRIPYNSTLLSVRASLRNAGATNPTTIDINQNGSTLLSTKLTIDAGALTSTTAATPFVISNSQLDDDSYLSFDFDTVGVGAAGVKVTMYVRRRY